MGKYKFDWGKVKEEVKNSGKKAFEADPRFWKPTVDEKGNATAIIRFLPDREGTPFAKYYQHNFKYMLDGVKKFYIHNCINTFGYDKECPICKKNQEYYNSDFDSDKAIASERKRKLIFVSNILVIKNPAKPEDEGKVFLYQYGVKIYDKIKDKMFPSDETKALGEGMYDEYVPFDLEEGADFKFIQVKQGDYPNYDKSEFLKQKPVGNEKFIDKVMSEVHDLSEFTSEDKFISNEEVIKKIGKLLCIKETASTDTTTSTTTDNGADDDIPFFDNTPDTSSDPTDDLSSPEPSSSGDDDVDFFKNL